jgi:hypothetical protein
MLLRDERILLELRRQLEVLNKVILELQALSDAQPQLLSFRLLDGSKMPHQLDSLAHALRQEQDARDTQDAAQLIKQASSSLRAPLRAPISGLVKSANRWDNTGLAFRPKTKTVSQYGVIGLPPGQRATIMKVGHAWKTLLFRNGHSVCDWAGEYSDADAALEALNELVRISRLQDAARLAAGRGHRRSTQPKKKSATKKRG